MKKMLLSASFLLVTGYMFAAGLIPGQTYKLSLGEKVLTVENASLSDKANVVSWQETNVNAQRWVLVAGTGNSFQWTNAYSGQYLACNGTAASGTNVYQTASGEVAATWEITPVENKDNLYYITQSGFYLETADLGTDGSNVRLGTRRTGAAAERQMWSLEAVEAQPNYLTEKTRDAMMEGWKNTYYNESRGRLGEGGFWGDAEMFEVVLDAYETTGELQYKTMFDKLHTDFINRQGSNWANNPFNDDIAWIVIASVRGYLMTGKQSYLDVAKSNFDMMYKRAAVLPHGMLIWNANENPNGTNSCINGPAEVAACYLAMALGDESYYEKARSMYTAQREYLYQPSTGQVYDSFTWISGVPSNYNTWASTYNQGTFLGAAVMLYNHYGDEQYKADAEMIMKYVRRKMCDEYGIIKVCQGIVDGNGKLVGDLPGFKGILMRYVRRFMVDLYQPECAEWMAANAFHAYNNRNSYGVSCTAWLTKTVEEYTTEVPFTNYNKDPFGPSTAVSAAFNSYVGNKSIRKDAFAGVEAENFDYLNSICLQPADGTTTTPTMGGILSGTAYTGYRNVDFGTFYARSIELRVLPQLSGSKIEIRLDNPDGDLLGTAVLPSEQVWQTVSAELSKPLDGVRTIYLKYLRGTGSPRLQIDYFRFKEEGYTTHGITDNGGSITTSIQPDSRWTGAEAVIDNQITTGLTGTVSGDVWSVYQSPYPVLLKGYLLIAAEGTQGGDPRAWKLQGSEDGANWVDLDTQSNQLFETRYQKKQYDVSLNKAYTYFRLSVSEREGSTNRFQLSEWQLFGTALADNCITTDGGVLSAQYPAGIEKLNDKDAASVYQANGSDLWLEYRASAIYLPSSYSITTGDAQESDPKAWELYASQDGEVWVKVDQRTGQKFPYRGATYSYSLAAYPTTINTGYTYFRLHITENNGAADTRLAEWQLIGDYKPVTFYNDITANGGELTSSWSEGVNSAALRKLTDNDGNTVYTFGGDDMPWVEYKSPSAVQLKAFAIVSADEPSKDPLMIRMEYKPEGGYWTRAYRGEVAFTQRNQRLYIPCTRVASGQYFRLMIETVAGGNGGAQLAELELYGNGIQTNDLTAGGEIRAQYESGNSAESSAMLVDKKETTKYCAPFPLSAWISCQVPEPVKVNMYSFTSGNDNEERDPAAWVMEASNDGIDWTVIDTRENQLFSNRLTTQYYACNPDGQEYSHFRVRVTENQGDGNLQLSEWQLLFVDGFSVGVEAKPVDVSAEIRFEGDLLYVNVPDAAVVQIYNLSGVLMQNERVQPGVSTLPVSSMDKGIYIVRMQFSNRIISRKIIK
ncbi:glycoside hydrolase family 76 protein [Bacteroides sp.]